jgi:hypothetical protein
MMDDPLTVRSIYPPARGRGRPQAGLGGPMTATGRFSKRLLRDRFVASIQEDSDER